MYLIVFNGDVGMSPHEVHLNAAEGEEKRIPTQPAPDSHPDHDTRNRNRESSVTDPDHDTRNRNRECR